MIKVHIDADDAEVYANLDSKDEKLRYSFIVEALTNALTLLNESDVKAIIFVVGKNIEQNVPLQKLLEHFIKDGHSIGNHSYSHAEDFHHWGKEAQIQDIQVADRVIREYLNYQPMYFRGPGYSSNHTIQRSLLKLGYLYDCTRIPLLYSSGLDLYFKVRKQSKKRIPSILRVEDLYFALAKPIRGIEQELIHPNKIWGVPFYSTWIFRKKTSSHVISQKIENMQSPFLFHAIDFLDYSNKESSIPALRIEPTERFRIIREILIGLKSREF